ncbi:phosphatase [Lactiplantibacillus pentosus]|uniref:macro domain-containing protein n=1 Tax=Lactiplantibacillus pentosus TaxID=1589 RepID=UPI000EA9F0E7|nr:macro domain-containing protein [Lactiplantibacillus pentosus]AYG36961.1 phosphatase [Lactiplantibacillus pentosus]AYG39617.1 phosphatase [Lactiplantibacillus pentosus]
MLMYVDSNLFDSPAQVLVNTVNTVGVMGKGIALQFKKLYPEMFTNYQHFCESGALTVGKLYLYKTPGKWILNFPTKENWRNKSKLAYIEAGLKKFVATYQEKGIESISFPQLGTGNGGLDWEREVRPLMEKYLRKLPIKVYIHIYTGWEKNPEYKNIKEMRDWLESDPGTLSFTEFKQDFIAALPGRDFIEQNRHILVIDGSEKMDETAGAFLSVSHEDSKVHYSITQSNFADIWTRLRDQGVLLDVDFPQSVLENQDNGFLKRLLVKLPYITTLRMRIGDSHTTALSLRKQMLSRSNQKSATHAEIRMEG